MSRKISSASIIWPQFESEVARLVAKVLKRPLVLCAEQVGLLDEDLALDLHGLGVLALPESKAAKLPAAVSVAQWSRPRMCRCFLSMSRQSASASACLTSSMRTERHSWCTHARAPHRQHSKMRLNKLAKPVFIRPSLISPRNVQVGKGKILLSFNRLVRLRIV